MIRKMLAAAAAAVSVALLLTATTPAAAVFGDDKTVVRGGSAAASSYQGWSGGTFTATTFADMQRDTNGTPNNENDDRLNYGGNSVDVDVVTGNQWAGFVLCEVYGIPEQDTGPYCWWTLNATAAVAETKITIQKLKVAGDNGSGWEQHWSQTYTNGNQTDFFLPETNIDWNKKPRIRITVKYKAANGGGEVLTKSAWVTAWENI
jgi:hypothetical protein